MTKPVFSSRMTMMLVMLGMAVGTGNIWRFPRIAASNGGGSFLVAWLVFLLLWSIPLILVEFAAGKTSRSGPIGAFAVIHRFKYLLDSFKTSAFASDSDFPIFFNNSISLLR